MNGATGGVATGAGGDSGDGEKVGYVLYVEIGPDQLIGGDILLMEKNHAPLGVPEKFI